MRNVRGILSERLDHLGIVAGVCREIGLWALPVFCGDILERLVIEGQVGDHLLELAVFLFEVA